MTYEQYVAWLKDPSARPILLFELTPYLNGSPVTLYGASENYHTRAADTPANTTYRGGWKVGTAFSETLALDGQGKLSDGDIEIPNPDGLYDAWLGAGYIFANCSCKIFLGDVRWARAGFQSVFAGLMADNIDSRSRDVLNVKLRDDMERLNAPVTEHKLGGTTPNKDEIIPLGFGELHNITPLLVDPVNLVYQGHDGAVEPCTNAEARDEGAPVVATFDAATGQITLAAEPAGAVTVSMAGDSYNGVYADTVSTVIQRLVTGFGPTANRFISSELDAANLAAFDTAHPQKIGLFVDTRANLRATCQQVADTLGAQLVPSRLGQLRLLQVALPPPGTPLDIPEAWMLEDSLHIVQRPPVKAAAKLGFCHNWTEQKSLKAALPAAHGDLFGMEWLTSTSDDATVQAAYRLSSDAAQSDSLLIHRTDADAEAQRRRDLWKVQRTVYEFIGRAPCLQVELGGAVRIYNRRFGLSGGAVGMVVGLTYYWKERKVTMQVLV